MTPTGPHDDRPGPGPAADAPGDGSPLIKRWDGAPLVRELFTLNNMLMRSGDRTVAGLGLTSSRWILLGAIDDYDAPPSLTDLAADALLSLQNVHRMVTALESDGLVERFSKPGAGRHTFVRLTDRGAELLEASCRRGDELVAALLEGMSDAEIAGAQRTLDTLITNMHRLECTRGSTAPAPAGSAGAGTHSNGAKT